MAITNWSKELSEAKDRYGDMTETISMAGSANDWSRLFNESYGLTEGSPVLAWTEERVYFPVCYDGSEWLGSAPRNPTSIPQTHVGGGE